MSASTSRSMPSSLWLVAFVLIALNLRAPIVVIGPILEPIMSTLSIGTSTASLLTTLMILCFGLLSPLAPMVAGRLGLDRALALAMIAVAVGGLFRSVPSISLMMAGTILAGFGIACGNVFMPGLVKRDRPERIGPTMGIYTVVLGIGATLGSGTAVMLTHAFGTWTAPIRLWALLALPAFAIWAWFGSARQGRDNAETPVPITALLKSRVAWTLTCFMGLQSLGFYTMQTWLAKVVIDAGVSADRAALMVSTINLVSMPVSYIVARTAARRARHSLFILILTALIGTALAGLLLAPTAQPLLWAVLLGTGQGGCFAISLTLIVLRVRHAEHTAALSGMAQSVGYLMAACGPLLFGMLHSLTGRWQASLVMMIVFLIGQSVAGVLIGRPHLVEVKASSPADRGRK
ncbi:CynX/NimT family MFS transporter [Larsenimonas rhizosphaerae]|uniref:CynX/NimT family MFS transporter n=1 Tax=Larsenimonas rhizosphaerae TaxID=2944682 RepID=UPI00203344FA|nr:MFS transporter [Larsenimonas rhizosphaerae]MCM2129589.1 MFS transporter [Larsenimonas rhizosphaerae]